MGWVGTRERTTSKRRGRWDDQSLVLSMTFRICCRTRPERAARNKRGRISKEVRRVSEKQRGDEGFGRTSRKTKLWEETKRDEREKVTRSEISVLETIARERQTLTSAQYWVPDGLREEGEKRGREEAKSAQRERDRDASKKKKRDESLTPCWSPSLEQERRSLSSQRVLQYR